MNNWIAMVEARKGKKDAGWWFKVVTALLVVLVVVVLAVRLALRNGEVAAFRTQKLLADNAEKRQIAKAKIATSEQKAAAASKKATEAVIKATQVDEKIQKIEAVHNHEKEVLSRLKSWRDVDKYVR